MKNQVTSIEQSNRLLELGVPGDKASMVWTRCGNEWHLSVLPHYTAEKECIESGRSIPAFTVADLLLIMPKFIDNNRSLRIGCRPEICSGSRWCIHYEERATLWVNADFATLLDVCVLGIEWFLTNNYKLNV